MKIKYTAIVFLAFLLAFASCANPSPSLNIADLAISIDRTDLRGFTMSPKGELYAIPEDGALTQFTYEGEEVKTYPGTEGFRDLSANSGFIYAYDGYQGRFVKLDCETGEITPFGDEIIFQELKSVVIVEDTLYALIVPVCDDQEHVHDYYINEDGYMDFEEQLLSVDTKTGKTTDMGIDHIIAIYGGSDSTLYYYAYINDEYGIYSLKKYKSKKVHTLNNVGYTYAFVYENNHFIYLSLQNSTIGMYNCSNREETVIYNDFYLFSANEMQFYAGNTMLLRTHPAYSIGDPVERELLLFYNEAPFAGKKTEIADYPPETITIYALETFHRLINKSEIQKRGNITTKYIKAPLYASEQMAQFMMGDADVDIYILGTSFSETMPILKMGMYVPLTDSLVINDYLSHCFDYIAKGARTDSGDIWMLPLYTVASVLWYVPENFERFGLTPDDVRYFDDIIKTIKRLNDESAAYAAYVDYPTSVWYDFMDQYDRTYNTFNEKRVDYSTELFAHIFTTIWSGWHRYQDEPHPLFRSGNREWDGRGFIADMPQYDKSRVIIKYDTFSHMREIKNPLNGWRALPGPRISEDVQGNAGLAYYAVVNPLSKKREVAIRFLETIAQDPFEMIAKDYWYGDFFLYKDPEAYRVRYDISLPGFQDLFSIYQDGIIHIDSVFPRDHENYIEDYQAGRLTAEEAIMALQREVEMWLNE